MGATMNLGCPIFFQCAHALSIRDSPLTLPLGRPTANASSGDSSCSTHRRSSSPPPRSLTASLALGEEEVRVWMAIEQYWAGLWEKERERVPRGFLINLASVISRRWVWPPSQMESFAVYFSFHFGGTDYGGLEAFLSSCLFFLFYLKTIFRTILFQLSAFFFFPYLFPL